MSNWSKEQQEKANIATERKDKDKVSRETLGKYFFDLSKLTFTALCLGLGVSLIMDESKAFTYWSIVLVGILASYILARLGYNILKK